MDNIDSVEVGHDTFEYNKTIAKGGWYHSKATANEEKFDFLCENETSDTEEANDFNPIQALEERKNCQIDQPGKDNLNSTDKLNYSSHYKLNIDGISSSTLLDDLSIESKDEIFSKILNIEAELSLFYNQTMKKLNDLKEIVNPILKSKEVQSMSSQPSGSKS